MVTAVAAIHNDGEGRRAWHTRPITKIMAKTYSTHQYESSGIYIVCLCEGEWAVPLPPSTTAAKGGMCGRGI